MQSKALKKSNSVNIVTTFLSIAARLSSALCPEQIPQIPNLSILIRQEAAATIMNDFIVYRVILLSGPPSGTRNYPFYCKV